MSLFGALFTSVSGMSAQSQETAMISNNIANVDTIGYKGSNGAFYSLVTSSGTGGTYSPGTVIVNRVQSVSTEGNIQQTASSTDAAISGNGFFVVKSEVGGSQPFLYTRSGSFSEDSTGLLRNSAGFALYGWPLGSDGSLPANSGDLSSTVPVNVAFLGGLTKPTTSGDLSLNLDSEQAPNIPELAGVPSKLPISTTTAADFTRALTVYDALGSAQNLTFQFRKVDGPMAHSTTQTSGLALTTSLTDQSSFGNVAAGDEFSVKIGSITQTFKIGQAPTAAELTATPNIKQVNTVGDLVGIINKNFGSTGANTIGTATLDANGRLLIQADNPTDTMTMTNITGTPLGTGKSPAVDTGTLNFAGQPGTATSTTGSLSFTPQALAVGTGTPPTYAGSTYPQQGDFPSLSNTTNPNTSGWWQVTVLKPDGTSQTQGLMNFNGDGSLNASKDANGKIGINMTDIAWGNGSSVSNIDVNVGSFTQYAGQYNVVSSDQNGAALGLRTGVEITKEGLVVAQFSNGATADLYKIPLATFSNPNGLKEESGTAYSETAASGTDNLREAGDGGAGTLQSSSLEGSNIDLADEFAKLIVAQRAYSADTRVVNTVNDMTQDLLRLV